MQDTSGKHAQTIQTKENRLKIKRNVKDISFHF